MTDTDVLFDRTALDGLTLDNRVGLAPMTRVSATDDGRATEEMARYYRKFAEGGFSFLLTEGVYTDDEYSQGYLNQPGLVTDEQVRAWEPVTAAVHDADTPVFAQLMHAGAQAQGNPHVDDGETLAPSSIRPAGEMAEAYGGSGAFPVPNEATTEDLDAAREGFVDAALNAHEAGFDGVELHAANGYLLNEFLASDANRRDDEYGGDPEDRVRYPAEVLAAVADAVPEDFVVGVRVSQTKVTDDDYRWVEGERAAEVFFEALSADADYLHVTEPAITEPAFGDEGPTLAEAAAAAVEGGDRRRRQRRPRRPAGRPCDRRGRRRPPHARDERARQPRLARPRSGGRRPRGVRPRLVPRTERGALRPRGSGGRRAGRRLSDPLGSPGPARFGAGSHRRTGRRRVQTTCRCSSRSSSSVYS
nr:NADH:flavin oxidoreductase [Halomarina sp. PSRA2]